MPCRAVLITGGGTGLGLACATAFCKNGDHVCITGRRDSVLAKACADIKAAQPSAKIFHQAMDVRDVAAVHKCIETIVSVTGSLPEVILNNAAANFVSPTENLSPNAWRAIINIVLMGTINVTTEIGKRWIAQRQAGIKAEHSPQVVFLTVGTSYVRTGQAYLAPSSVAKGGVLNLYQSLAAEWGKYNMRFVTVSPGPIFTEGAFARLDPMGAFNAIADDREELGKIVPLARLIKADEYAEFMVFVASEKARWLSGTNIHYDGGSYAGGGEFVNLRDIPQDKWKEMEAKIRKTSAESKAQRQRKDSKL